MEVAGGGEGKVEEGGRGGGGGGGRGREEVEGVKERGKRVR